VTIPWVRPLLMVCLNTTAKLGPGDIAPKQQMATRESHVVMVIYYPQYLQQKVVLKPLAPFSLFKLVQSCHQWRYHIREAHMQFILSHLRVYKKVSQ
jgi:hypothetical protein